MLEWQKVPKKVVRLNSKETHTHTYEMVFVAVAKYVSVKTSTQATFRTIFCTDIICSNQPPVKSKNYGFSVTVCFWNFAIWYVAKDYKNVGLWLFTFAAGIKPDSPIIHICIQWQTFQP